MASFTLPARPCLVVLVACLALAASVEDPDSWEEHTTTAHATPTKPAAAGHLHKLVETTSKTRVTSMAASGHFDSRRRSRRDSRRRGGRYDSRRRYRLSEVKTGVTTAASHPDPVAPVHDDAAAVLPEKNAAKLDAAKRAKKLILTNSKHAATHQEKSSCFCGQGFCQHVKDTDSHACYVCLNECEKMHRGLAQMTQKEEKPKLNQVKTRATSMAASGRWDSRRRASYSSSRRRADSRRRASYSSSRRRSFDSRRRSYYSSRRRYYSAAPRSAS